MWLLLWGTQSGELQPLRAKDLEGLSPLHCSVLLQFLDLLLIQSIGSTGSIPPLLLVSMPLLCVFVAILLIQDVQQHVPLSHQLQVRKFLQVLLPGLKPEEPLEFLYPHQLLGVTPLHTHKWLQFS